MFGNEITLAETGIITLLGMSIVFIILILLTFILTLFKYIFVNTVNQNQPSTKINTTKNPTEVTVSDLEKAIIIAAILEDLGVQENNQQVRIKNICKIS